jgi:hypothetical protein
MNFVTQNGDQLSNQSKLINVIRSKMLTKEVNYEKSEGISIYGYPTTLTSPWGVPKGQQLISKFSGNYEEYSKLVPKAYIEDGTANDLIARFKSNYFLIRDPETRVLPGMSGSPAFGAFMRRGEKFYTLFGVAKASNSIAKMVEIVKIDAILANIN